MSEFLEIAQLARDYGWKKIAYFDHGVGHDTVTFHHAQRNQVVAVDYRAANVVGGCLYQGGTEKVLKGPLAYNAVVSIIGGLN